MKRALVHDWLVTIGGAEKVLKGLIDLFPEADIYTLVDFLSPKEREEILKGKISKTTFIQKLPQSKYNFRNYLPLFPKAFESLDLDQYDTIISSSWAFAKGIRTTKNQLHICYCHTPIRYVWDLYEEYTQNLPFYKKLILKPIFAYIRKWDKRNSEKVDYFIANSKYVQNRIKRIYKRDSKVIYPPVDIDIFSFFERKQDYYITVSRLVPYKKVDLIVKAFCQNGKPLIVVGDGPQKEYLRSIATKNIDIIGFQDLQEVVKLVQMAKGFVYAALEDFGIAPVEAQACGTPVISLGKGGTSESVIDGITGVHFYEQTLPELQNAIKRFEREYENFDFRSIRAHSQKFSKKRFLQEMEEFIKNKEEKRC